MNFDDIDVNDIQEETTSGFQNLRETGVYDVTLKRVGFKEANSGAVMLNLTVNGGGKFDDIFYQGPLKKKNGEYGYEMDRLLKPLAYITGVKAFTTGKYTTDNGKEIDIFNQFPEKKIKIAVQNKWSDYRGEMVPEIVKVFDESGRTASEIKTGKDAEQIKWYLSDKFKDIGPKGKKSGKSAEEAKADIPDDFGEDAF